MVACDQQPLELLRREDTPQYEVMAALTSLDASTSPFRSLKLGILSNITVDLLAVFLRRQAYLTGVRLQVAKGTYDDAIGDAQSHQNAGVDIILILLFFDNLQPSWESQLASMSETDRDAVQNDALGRLDIALNSARDVGQILILGAHLCSPHVGDDSPQQKALTSFNDGLIQLTSRHPQARFIGTSGLLARFGADHAFDTRFYFRAKAPYTARFMDQLAHEVAISTRSFGQVFHKVLVLDCDNTLWGGIVGEEGLEGIQLNRFSYPGNVFWTVQQQILQLERQGVLICLCSKNNYSDVNEVIRLHPDMVLRDEYIVASKINWEDKPANLRALASELNLGLDSFVFLDDSAFEVSAVKEQLPQVRVFQVPDALHDYPTMLREQVTPLFLAGGVSAENHEKTQQYRNLLEAAQLQASFASHDDYLYSLNLVLYVERDALNQLPRITELMAKSNQFNLTTERLSAGDLATLMARSDATVYSFSVTDRLAQHGLTGVLITEDHNEVVFVHSFLMSCRVIGRGVEFAVWRAVIADALTRGKLRLKARYRVSEKNAQVADFYDQLGLVRTCDTQEGGREYEADLCKLKLTKSLWIRVENA
jgi:FkbH-like protein